MLRHRVQQLVLVDKLHPVTLRAPSIDNALGIAQKGQVSGDDGIVVPYVSHSGREVGSCKMIQI